MRIACISDVHYTNMRFRGKAMRELNRAFYKRFFARFFSIPADYYICLGDITHYGTRGQLREAFALIDETKRPEQQFEVIIGNHDILFGHKRRFRELSGVNDLYRMIETPEARLMLLDTARVRAFRKDSSLMGIQQSRWISKELLASGDRPVLVFAHHPADQITMTDHQGRFLPHLTLVDVLHLKEGSGIYVNGHKHRNRFHLDRNWAFVQMNDVIDEPSIRILDVSGGNLEMHAVAVDDPEMLEMRDKIARRVFTFKKTRNDAPFTALDEILLFFRDDVAAGFTPRRACRSSKRRIIAPRATPANAAKPRRVLSRQTPQHRADRRSSKRCIAAPRARESVATKS